MRKNIDDINGVGVGGCRERCKKTSKSWAMDKKCQKRKKIFEFFSLFFKFFLLKVGPVTPAPVDHHRTSELLIRSFSFVVVVGLLSLKLLLPSKFRFSLCCADAYFCFFFW